MAKTYSSSNSPLDRARRVLGDTGVDGGVFLLSDEEILAELSVVRYNEAVAILAEGLATRFAQFPDETDTPGGHTLKWSERVEAWFEIAKRMRAAPEPGRKPGSSRLGNLTNPTETKLR